ncbi:hypothetical protein BT96DRAFT_985399 [Gymnopus androsaceus JB14]|uniref:Uncharacterized protein n=1 Tax=Gymnopus androsaceus JB14 TaxID=1447944 RepID=A0A6A4IEP0_9AGAR|nr:hypothetical protein BT96DRAFT_985399 [Gymnopus androsaceus JB14]
MRYRHLTAFLFLLFLVLYIEPGVGRPIINAADLSPRNLPKEPVGKPSDKTPSSTGKADKSSSASHKSPGPLAKSSAKQSSSSSASCPLASSKSTNKHLVKRADVCGISARLQNLARDGCTANSESITFDQQGLVKSSPGKAENTQCDHVLELQIVKAALAGEICDALNNMIETARNLEVSVDGLTVVKKEILETIFVKLNADARNLFYLSTPVNQAKGRFVGKSISESEMAPATDQNTKNVGYYLVYADGGASSKGAISKLAEELDTVVDTILEETAKEAKDAINAKLEKGGTERTVMACSAQIAEIDSDLNKAKDKKAISKLWTQVKKAATKRS